MTLSTFIILLSNYVLLNRKGLILVIKEKGNLQISSWIFKG